MSEQYDFKIPTDNTPEDNLDDILKEFSIPEAPEIQTEDAPPAAPAKKSSSAFKIVALVCTALILVAAIVVGIVYLQWNQQYQASLPEEKSAEAFSLLFKDPDWALLYNLAGIENTPFENRDTFVQYMNTVAGGKRLNYMLLPQTDPLVREYAVYFDSNTVGSFTMVGTEDAIPDWNLGSVDFVFDRSHNITIYKSPDHKAYVNGVTLDDSYVVRSTSTAAEAFLPEGVHGYRLDEIKVTDLLLEPLVTVTDASGVPIPMVYDSDTHTYSPLEETGSEIADNHLQFALDAAKASAAFAVRANSFTDLRQFFDPNSNAYEVVYSTQPLLEGCADYSFDPSATEVTNYRSYGNSLFSATVTLKLDVTMENGDAHSFDLSWHYLYMQNHTGNFLITEIGEQSFHTPQEQVRLTFIQEGQVVESQMVDVHQSTVILPQITAPEGKVAAGWAQKHTNSQGDEIMDILFPAAAGSIAQFPQDGTLEPMTLYAVYEDIS